MRNNVFKRLLKISKHFFKDLFKQLKSVKDPRNNRQYFRTITNYAIS